MDLVLGVLLYAGGFATGKYALAKGINAAMVIVMGFFVWLVLILIGAFSSAEFALAYGFIMFSGFATPEALKSLKP
jgi:hypothetical protein